MSLTQSRLGDAIISPTFCLVESRSPGATTDTQIADISPEALNTLSSDQVQTLVTSNSVNYDVIQQIMAQKQQRQSSPGSVGSATEEAASMATTGPAESENKAGQPDVTGSMQAPVVHITPEQLKQLQIQVTAVVVYIYPFSQ